MGHSERLNNDVQKPRYVKQSISVACVFLAFLIFVILGFLPVAPEPLVKSLKPVFLVICVLNYRNSYRFGYEKWFVLLHVYLLIIWLANLETNSSISDYVSMLLFLLFFLFAGLRMWNSREIRFIVRSIFYACLLYSALVLGSNGGLIHAGGSQHISFLSHTLNRNSSAFAVTPGVICSAFLLFYDRQSPFERFIYGIGFVICFYTVIGLSCRSAFLSASSGTFLVVWQATKKSGNSGQQFLLRLLFVFVVVCVLGIGMRALEGTDSARIFDYSDTGRDDLWEAAWDLIHAKPIFGGGFTYWSDSGQVMSPHNTFLNIMMISGYVGGAILGLAVLSMMMECLRAGNIIALAFSMEMLFHSISEAGLDYFAYIPLILTSILLRCSEYQSKDLSKIFAPYPNYVRGRTRY